MKQRITLLLIGLLCCFQLIKAQTSGDVIVGNVFSKLDGALIGVSIQEIDETNRTVSGTVTDINGDFSLRIKNPKHKLVFTYIGYQKLTKSIGSDRKFTIEMTETSQTLDEVVITSKKRTRAGGMDIPERETSMAMQTIKADFGELSVASLDEALQGQIAGLDIISNSGDVGSGSAMRLRGTASINANVTPLVVVNDYIWDTSNNDTFDFVNANNESFANLLSINVDDIESISVAKDGAATAMWGSQGANGVITIRTRQGAMGKPKLQYTYRLSQKWQPEGMKMLSGDEYTMYMKEAYFNPNHSDAASNIKELNYIQNDGVFADWRMYDNNTDWVDAVKQTGASHDHYIGIDGGGERADFRISAGYFTEEGSIIGQGLDRLTSRITLNYRVSDRIRFRSEMSFTYTDEERNYADNDKNKSLLGTAYGKMPNLAIYREEQNGVSTGEYYTIPGEMSSVFDKDQKVLWNPVAVANLAENEATSYQLDPTFSLEYDLMPRTERQMLRVTASVKFGIKNSSSYAFFPRELTSANWSDGSINRAQSGDNKSHSTTARLAIDWIPNISNEDHTLITKLQGETYTENGSSQSEESYGIPSGIGSPSAGSYTDKMGTSKWQNRSVNVIGSLHYSFKSKYNLGLTVRHEGNTKFGDNKRYGTFGGVSARWNIIDEPFMESTYDWMSMLALRVSAGITGAAPKDNYLHFSKYSTGGSYLGSSSIYLDAVQLKNIKWETTKDWNLGMDLGFFDDLFTADMNYYKKVTSDLLHKDVKIPTSSGFTQYNWYNVGKVENEGWELNMFLNNIIKVGKFSVDFNMNFANNRNIVRELDDIILSSYNKDYGFSNGEYMTRLQIGNSLGSIYGFKYKGVYQYSIDNQDLIDSNYTLGTAPIARDANGNVIFDSEGKPVPMYFAYGTDNQLQFHGGDAIYEDINNDGNINELDIVYLGNSNPKLNGGMGFKIKYDRFSVNVYSVFRYGNKIVNIARMNAENMHTNYNQSRAVNWRWRKEGDETSIPRALRDAGRNYLGSDRFVENGSFWRLNTISANYSVPKQWTSKVGLSNASLFLTVYNVYCFTNYSGVDPEVGYGSWGLSKDENQTPRSKSFTAGCTINF